MFSSSKKPYSAITVQIDRLTSEQYEADDLSGIVDLIEVIRLQAGGPTEAARAIRKKLKYGTVHKQLRALTVLDGLIENAGPRFQRAFADEPLLERLRVAATDSLSDAEVKQKCQILFRQWAVDYKSTPGMERVAALHRQLPQRKRPVRQEQSKVLKDSEPEANEDPFSNNDSVSSSGGPVQFLRTPDNGSLSSASAPLSSGANVKPLPKSSKAKHDKNGKKVKSKPFNLEKEKPQLLQTIASSSVASTNLMNSLKLINREHKRVSEDLETLKRFETCKLLRRQILRYIQHVESEQWLGSLIHANEELVTALMSFEVLDKSLEDDSDSEDNEWDDDAPSNQKFAQEAFAGLTIANPANEKSPARALDGKGKADEFRDDDTDDENISEEEADDDPFADSNAVQEEKRGIAWKQ